MTTTVDKCQFILGFLLPLYEKHKKLSPNLPFVIGIGGLQGSGKSYTVLELQNLLKAAAPHSSVIACSIDDFYYPYDQLERLRLENPDNKLLSQRGAPGTHDVALMKQVFESLFSGDETKIPLFDKSQHGGKGDRVEQELWTHAKPPVDIILFEGWCAGFRSVSEEDVKAKREKSTMTLNKHRLEHLEYINNALKQYDDISNRFDAFVHLDAAELSFVYAWRLEQEHALIRAKGQGMTDEEVVNFINGYMPGYELYLDNLREGMIADVKKDGEKRQLRLVMDKMRNVIASSTL